MFAQLLEFAGVSEFIKSSFASLLFVQEFVLTSVVRLRQAGFTLIELVVVIIILGILSAVALPRFIDMGSDARIATVKAMDGALLSAATQVNMTCRLTPPCDVAAPTQMITMRGKDYWLHYGYPDAGDGIGNVQIDTVVTHSGFLVELVNSGATRFSPVGVKDPAACNVTYYDAFANTAPGVFGKINTVVTVTGC